MLLNFTSGCNYGTLTVATEDRRAKIIVIIIKAYYKGIIKLCVRVRPDSCSCSWLHVLGSGATRTERNKSIICEELA